MDRLEYGAAQAVIALAIVQPVSWYRDAAPRPRELRAAAPGDPTMSQALMDADLFGGVAVLLVGGIAAWLTRGLLPLLLAASGVLLISLYHRSILASTQIGDSK